MTVLLSIKLGETDVFVARIDGSGYAEQHKVACELLGAAFLRLYGEYYDEMPMIEKTPEGKPYFVDCPNIFFSVSHTSDYAAVALGDKPVGIDIERIRPYNKKIASRWLCAFTEDGDESDVSFTRAWTKLESLGKLNGKGIIGDAAIEGVEFFSYEELDGHIITAAQYF